MVVHRTCSFCAGEIEPGTGLLFVKRDGSLFAFCSSSCRKQQLGLGRVGHRLRWTRAHELKRLAEQRRQPTAEAAPAPAPAKATKGRAKSGAQKPVKAAAEAPSAPSTESAAPAKKPRARKPASSNASS